MNVCEKMNLAGFYRAKKNLRWQWWLFWIIVIIISASGTIFFDWQFPAEYLDFTVKSISASLGNDVFQNIVLQPRPEFFQGSILIVQIFFQDIYLTDLVLPKLFYIYYIVVTNQLAQSKGNKKPDQETWLYAGPIGITL